MIGLVLLGIVGPWVLVSHWTLQQCHADGCQPYPGAGPTQVYRLQTFPTQAACLVMGAHLQARTDAVQATLHQAWRDQSPASYVHTRTRFVCLPEDDLRGTSVTER